MRRIHWREERGTAAVEFALVMVLLFTIVFGIIAFGVAFSKLNVLTGAAREGARYAAVRCKPDPSCTGGSIGNISSRVKAAAAGYTVGPGVPTANIVCSDATVGQSVTVSWSQNITIDIPFIPGMNPATITRTMKGVFRCE